MTKTAMTNPMMYFLVAAVPFYTLVVADTAAAQQAKPPVCPQSMMREIDAMNKLYLEAGRRYSYVVASSCDDKGRVTELVLTRQRDGKVIRWKTEQGPAALARIILSGAER